jgi:hypothetical protein
MKASPSVWNTFTYASAVNCPGSAHVRLGIKYVTVKVLNPDKASQKFVKTSLLDPRGVRESTIVGTEKMVICAENEPQDEIRIYDKCVEVQLHYETYTEYHYSYHTRDILTPYLKKYGRHRIGRMGIHG